MLPDKLALDIVTAERRVLTEEVDEIVLPGTVGYLGVRPGHTPLLTGLGTLFFVGGLAFVNIRLWRRTI